MGHRGLSAACIRSCRDRCADGGAGRGMITGACFLFSSVYVCVGVGV